MSTTVLLFEILIIGIFTSIWITMLVIMINYGYDFDLEIVLTKIQNKFGYLKFSSPLILFLSLAILYQIGWMMNDISYYLSRKIYANRMIRKLTEIHPELENHFDEEKPERYQLDLKAPSDFLKKLREHLVVYRLTRTGMFNFLILAFLILIHNLANWPLFLILLMVSLICYFQSHFTCKTYINQIFSFYKYSELDGKLK